MAKSYRICGYEIPVINPGPYNLVVIFTNGREKVIHNSHNPQEAWAAHERVTRNIAVIQRIELRDHEGCLETIWDKDWNQ